MDMKCGWFVGATDDSVAVAIGFVPDFLILRNLTTGEPFCWGKALHDAGIETEFGFIPGESTAGHAAEYSSCLDEAGGISAYDVGGDFVNIPHPRGGKRAVQVNDWEASSTIVHGATDIRTLSNIGRVVRPVGRYGLVFEAIDDGANSSTANTPSNLSGQSAGISFTDSDITWLPWTEEVVRGGGKGFVVGSSVCETAGASFFFVAFRTDVDKYVGDGREGDLSLI